MRSLSRLLATLLAMTALCALAAAPASAGVIVTGPADTARQQAEAVDVRALADAAKAAALGGPARTATRALQSRTLGTLEEQCALWTGSPDCSYNAFVNGCSTMQARDDCLEYAKWIAAPAGWRPADVEAARQREIDRRNATDRDRDRADSDRRDERQRERAERERAERETRRTSRQPDTQPSASPPPAAPFTASTAPDPVTREGGAFKFMEEDSPLCKGDLEPVQRRNCRRTGDPAYEHPIQHFGIDWHIDTGAFGLGVNGNLMSLWSWIIATVWLLLVYFVKALNTLLAWTFTFNILGGDRESENALAQGIARLHNRVLGPDWTVFALAVLGGILMFKAFVKGEMLRSLRDLLASCLLMVLALVVIANPFATVGEAQRVLNAGAGSVISGVTTGEPTSNEQALGKATGDIWQQIVKTPWCALEFANTTWCNARIDDRSVRYLPEDKGIKDRARQMQANDPHATNGDVWLSYKALGEERNAMYEAYKHYQSEGGNVPNDLARLMSIQKGGMMTVLGRTGLMLTIAVGMLFAALLFGWLAFRLVTAALQVALLLLFTPIMLIFAAFGEAGRNSMYEWMRRLVGAMAAKLVFALYLAVVVLLSSIVAAAGNEVSWFLQWLMLAAFWIFAFLHRNDVLGLLSVGGLASQDSNSKGLRVMSAIFAARTGAQAAGWMRRRHQARRAVKALAAVDGRAADTTATATVADGALAQRQEAKLDSDYRDARGEINRADEWQRRWDANERNLRDYDAWQESGQGVNYPYRNDQDRQRIQGALSRRRQLEAERPDMDRIAVLRRNVAAVDASHEQNGQRWSERDRARAAEAIRSQLVQAAGGSLADPARAQQHIAKARIGAEHAHFIGRSASEFKNASDSDRERFVRDIRAAMSRAADLQAFSDQTANGHAISPRQIDAVAAHLDPSEVRARRAEALQTIQRDRHAEQLRRDLERRRVGR